MWREWVHCETNPGWTPNNIPGPIERTSQERYTQQKKGLFGNGPKLESNFDQPANKPENPDRDSAAGFFRPSRLGTWTAIWRLAGIRVYRFGIPTSANEPPAMPMDPLCQEDLQIYWEHLPGCSDGPECVWYLHTHAIGAWIESTGRGCGTYQESRCYPFLDDKPLVSGPGAILKKCTLWAQTELTAPKWQYVSAYRHQSMAKLL